MRLMMCSGPAPIRNVLATKLKPTKTISCPVPKARPSISNRKCEAYKTQVVNLAQGDAKAFLAIYDAYKLSKDVTAWRLYLDSTDQLLRKATKVILNSSGKGVSGVVPYLPMSDGTAKQPATQGAAK